VNVPGDGFAGRGSEHYRVGGVERGHSCARVSTLLA
jgi:hypothetical protein